MKISNNYNGQNFNGRFYLKGNYSTLIKEALHQNPYVKKMENLKDDVCCIIKSKENSKEERYFNGKDDIDYKLYFMKLKTPSNFINKVINFFALKKPVTNHFHSEDTTLRIIKSHIDDVLLNEMGFKI